MIKTTKYFSEYGKKNISKSKAVKLIEKVCPDILAQKHIRPSMFINNYFEKIERKFKPNNALRGSIFEYLMMCVFFRKYTYFISTYKLRV